MEAKRRSPYVPRLEALEDRSLLATALNATLSYGVLRIEGTDYADRINVRQINSRISVEGISIRLDGQGTVSSIAASDVRQIQVRGLGGNDWIDIGGEPTSESNTLRAPTSIWAGTGNDQVWGSYGNDLIYGESGDDTLYGRAGNDFLSGGDGSNRLDGGTGDDTLSGGGGYDQIWAGDGNDRVDGGSGNDRLFGGMGDDRIDGGLGTNLILGHDGNDQLLTGGTTSSLDGGNGTDSAYLTATSPGGTTFRYVESIKYGTTTTTTTSTTTTTTTTTSSTTSVPYATEVQRIIDMTNSYRASKGLQRLTIDSRLTAAARYQADYMARTGIYAHVNDDGRTVADRAHAAGYYFSIIAENIHMYDPDIRRTLGISREYSLSELAQYFFDGWKVSPGHNQNMLLTSVRHIGVALARASSGEVYAVMVLGNT